MIAQIICNTTMFLVYIGVIVFTVYSLIVLPKRLKSLSVEEKDISQDKAPSNRAKIYTKKFFLLLLFHVCATIINGIMCILDGLSDTENGLIVPTWVFLACALALTIFLTVYTEIMRKKYKIKTSPSSNPIGNPHTNAPVDLVVGISIAVAFALNSAIVAYTIRLLLI